MTTADQFLKALAVVESSDDPEAWGDNGQAMGRWQVHPARLWQEAHLYQATPNLRETWDQLVARILRAMFTHLIESFEPDQIAMYWHVGHMTNVGTDDWDTKYAARFNAALANAEEDMP